MTGHNWPPGWYHDAWGALRWWDGSQWTAHTQPPPAQAPTAASEPGRRLSGQPAIFWVGVAGAAFLILGGFGPWATALDGVVSVQGTHGDGWVAIAGGLVALGMLWLAADRARRINAALPIIVAGICLFVAVIDIADINQRSPLIDPGWGLWLVVVASMVLGGASIALLMGRPAPAPPSTTVGPAAPAAPDPEPAPAASGAPAPAWFPDPRGQAPYRWWDGTTWTEHTSAERPR